MEDYQKRFINFLLETEALKIGGDFKLKSGRRSPFFVNIGDFDDGITSTALGAFYADVLAKSGEQFDLIYGIPDKGREIAVATSNEMARRGLNVPRFSTRVVPKDHGEGSALDYGRARKIKEFIAASQSLPQADRIRSWVIGRAPKNGQSIAQLDDVFTAGNAKYEAIELLKFLGDFKLPVLAIAVDRQEVGVDGKNAIAEYEARTGIKVVSIANASDIYNYLKENAVELANKGLIDAKELGGEFQRRLDRMANYMRVYGTEEARQTAGKLEQTIISRDRSVILACDFPFEQFEDRVIKTADIDGIGGYKIPAVSGRKGWERWIETARKHTNKPLIYDHQKAGTDIPDTGQQFMRDLKESGFDAVILFPQAGPETERACIYHALDQGLKVIIGGPMTHPGYKESEGGFLSDEGVFEMIRIGAKAGLNNFVAPGTKLDDFKRVTEIVEEEGVRNPVYYAPGFIAQGGKIADAAKVAGERFHGIVGRGIYAAPNIQEAAIEHTSSL